MARFIFIRDSIRNIHPNGSGQLFRETNFSRKSLRRYTSCNRGLFLPKLSPIIQFPRFQRRMLLSWINAWYLRINYQNKHLKKHCPIAATCARALYSEKSVEWSCTNCINIFVIVESCVYKEYLLTKESYCGAFNRVNGITNGKTLHIFVLKHFACTHN